MSHPPVQLQFEASVFPEGDINRHLYTVTVAYRGADRWAVVRHRQCLGVDGTWDYEMRPSERDDEWLDAHRFDLDTAQRLAVEAAPGIRVNGRSAVEAYQLTQGDGDPA